MSCSEILISYIESTSELLECAKSIHYPFQITFMDCLTVVSDHNPISDVNNLLHKANTVVDFIHDELNTGHWSEVPESTRRVFTAASYIKVSVICLLYI